MSDSPFKLADGSDAKPGQIVYTVDSRTGIITPRTVNVCVMIHDTPHVISGGAPFKCDACYPTRFAARERSRRDAEFGIKYHTEQLELCHRAIRELGNEPGDLPAPLPLAPDAGPADDFGEMFETGEPIA